MRASRRTDASPVWLSIDLSHYGALPAIPVATECYSRGNNRGVRPAGVHINFEDTRLFGLSPADFPSVLRALDEHWRGQPVFLDEVQEVDEWQRFVRAL